MNNFLSLNIQQLKIKYINKFDLIQKTKLKKIYSLPDFLYIWSKQVEHNKCPFFFQNVLVDLSISFLQIKHLNIGDILGNFLNSNYVNFIIKDFFFSLLRISEKH